MQCFAISISECLRGLSQTKSDEKQEKEWFGYIETELQQGLEDAESDQLQKLNMTGFMQHRISMSIDGVGFLAQPPTPPQQRY